MMHHEKEGCSTRHARYTGIERFPSHFFVKGSLLTNVILDIVIQLY
jgi:hypothetical protein